MRDEEARRRRSPLAIALLAVQALVGAVASFFVLFRRISIPHCGTRCDFALLDTTGNLFVLLVVLLLIASALIVMLSRRRVWWVPLVGIAITLVAAFFANRVSDIALLF